MLSSECVVLYAAFMSHTSYRAFARPQLWGGGGNLGHTLCHFLTRSFMNTILLPVITNKDFLFA